MNYEQALQYFLDLANIKEDGSSFIFDFRYNWVTLLIITNIVCVLYCIYKDRKTYQTYERGAYIALTIILPLYSYCFGYLAPKNVYFDNIEYNYNTILTSPYYQNLPDSAKEIMNKGLIEDINDNKHNLEFKTSIRMHKFETILQDVSDELYRLECLENEKHLLEQLETNNN